MRTGVGSSARRRKPFDHGQPLSRPDTLPLLFFCIFLVIFVLMTIAPRTHALLFDIPNPVEDNGEVLPGFLITDRVGVTENGELTMNGLRVTQQQLLDMLVAARREGQVRGLVFAPHPKSRYNDALRALAIIKFAGAGDAGFCFGAIEQHRSFGKLGRDAPVAEHPPHLPCDPARDWRLSPAW